MNEIVYVTEVHPLDGFWVRLAFSDGAVKEIDLSELLAAGGVFTPIYEQREVFQQVAVNPESGTCRVARRSRPRPRGPLRALRAGVRSSDRAANRAGAGGERGLATYVLSPWLTIPIPSLARPDERPALSGERRALGTYERDAQPPLFQCADNRRKKTCPSDRQLQGAGINDS